MFKKILVPLDGSRLAECALHAAAVIARAHRAELILLHVPFVREMYPTSVAGYEALVPDYEYEEPRDAVQEYLQLLQMRLQTDTLHVRVLVEDGDEASVILETVAAEAVDLIVMTTHGRTGLTRWVLGSVTERVLRDAPCSVLMLRDDRPIKQLLVTLDGSPLAERAVAPAIAVAQATEAQVTLLAVAEEGRVSLLEAAQVDVVVSAETQPDLSEAAMLHDYLAAYCAGRDWHGVDVTQEVAVGSPGAAIIDYAEAHDVDLIAMATHGRSGLRRWIYGSVTTKVMRSAERAMLIVRPPAEVLRAS